MRFRLFPASFGCGQPIRTVVSLPVVLKLPPGPQIPISRVDLADPTDHQVAGVTDQFARESVLVRAVLLRQDVEQIVLTVVSEVNRFLVRSFRGGVVKTIR